MREQTLHVLQAEETTSARAQWQNQPGVEKARGKVVVGDAIRGEREAGGRNCVGGGKDFGFLSG